MEQNKPFYRFEGIEGVGVLLDGGCGFQLIDFRPEEGKSYPCLRILPLKYKQEPGEMREDNEVVNECGFVEIAFGSEKSLDAMIDALNIMKKHCFKTKADSVSVAPSNQVR